MLAAVACWGEFVMEAASCCQHCMLEHSYSGVDSKCVTVLLTEYD